MFFIDEQIKKARAIKALISSDIIQCQLIVPYHKHRYEDAKISQEEYDLLSLNTIIIEKFMNAENHPATKRIPKGELITRTIAMPADTNSNGDIFGGWIMSLMDIASGIIASSTVRTRVTTVAVDGMTFHQPVHVGDTVACYGKLEKIGNSSMKIRMEVWSQRHLQSKHICVTEAIFTYVAINDEGKPTKIKPHHQEIKMVSLQDQLLKTGIVDKKKVKKVRLAKHIQTKKQPKGQIQVDENKLQAEKALAERTAKDRVMNQEKQLKAEVKAVQAQIIQLIKVNAIDCQNGEISYQFTDANIISKIYVTQTLQKQLSEGIVAIAKLGDDYHLVPAIVAEKIIQRDASYIVVLNDNLKTETDEDDPYADYQIPDDLIW